MGRIKKSLKLMFFLFLITVPFYTLFLRPYIQGSVALFRQSSILLVYEIAVLWLINKHESHKRKSFVGSVPFRSVLQAIKRHSSWIIPAFIIFYSLAFLKGVFFCDFLTNGDGVFHFFAGYELANRSNKTVPWGWLDIYGGLPFFMFYPPMFYYYTIPFFMCTYVNPYLVYHILLVILYVLIALTTYFFLRTLDIGKIESLIACLAVMSSRFGGINEFSTASIFWLGTIPFSFSFIFLNLFMAFFFRSLKYFHQKDIVLAALFFALTFLSHPYSIYVGSFVAIAFTVYRMIMGDRRNVLLTGIKFSFLSLLFSSSWLIPMFSLKEYSIAGPMRVTSDISGKLYKFFTQKTVDGKLPVLTIFGFVGLLASLCGLRKKDKSGIVFLSIYGLVTMALIKGITNYINIPYLNLLEFHERTYAYLRFIWPCLGVVGISEFVRALGTFLGKYRYVLLLMLFTIVIVDQIHVNNLYAKFLGFECLSETGLKNDVFNIANILNEQEDDARVMTDTMSSLKKWYVLWLIPHLTNRGYHLDWPAAWHHMKLRHYNFIMYDNYLSNNVSKFVDALEEGDTKYLILNKVEDSVHDAIIGSERFETLWSDDLILLRVRGNFSRVYIPPSVVAIIDERIFWKDIYQWYRVVNSVLSHKKYAVVILNPEELEGVELFDFIVIGKLDCETTQELLKRLTSKIVFILPSNNCGCKGENIFPVDESELWTTLDRVVRKKYEGSVEYRNKGFGKSIEVKSDGDLIPVIIRDNYYRNWKASQADNRLKIYFSLPSYMLLFVKPGSPVSLTYEQHWTQSLGLILTMATCTLLIISFSRR